jgi:hypothetical protein
VLAVPAAHRGSDELGSVALAIALARGIGTLEESGELPFGDTVEVSRQELDGKLARRARREDA